MTGYIPFCSESSPSLCASVVGRCMSAATVDIGPSGVSFCNSSGNCSLTRNQTCYKSNLTSVSGRQMPWHPGPSRHKQSRTNLDSWRWMANQANLLPAWYLVCRLERPEACLWSSLLQKNCILVNLECDNFHSGFVALIPRQMQISGSRSGTEGIQEPTAYFKESQLTRNRSSCKVEENRCTYQPNISLMHQSNILTP